MIYALAIFTCGFAVGCCAAFLLVAFIDARRAATAAEEHRWHRQTVDYGQQTGVTNPARDNRTGLAMANRANDEPTELDQ